MIPTNHTLLDMPHANLYEDLYGDIIAELTLKADRSWQGRHPYSGNLQYSK